MATYQRRGDSVRAIIRKAGFAAQTATFDTEDAAREWVARVEARMAAGLEPVGGPISTRTALNDLFDTYMVEHYAVQFRSVDSVKYLIAALVARFDSMRKPIGEFTADDVNNIIAARMRPEKKSGFRAVKAGTVRRECAILSGFFEWCIDVKGLKLENVIRRAKLPPEPKPRTQRMSDDELALVLKQLGYVAGMVPETSKQWAAFALLLSTETALRRGNLLGVRWRDLRPFEGVIYIPRTKNEDPHEAALTSKARALLATLPRGEPDDQIIPLSGDNYWRIWREAAKACGLSDRRIHDLRRESTWRAAAYLPNAIELAAFTGHRKLESLRIYYAPQGRDIAKKLP